jgi:HPr kinase/phosphorylase
VSTGPTIHASAVLVGASALLIRGPSGAGKSRLALELIQAAAGVRHFGSPLFTRLVGDDRVHVAAAHGRLLVRPASQLAGLIEVRGLGIIRLPHEPVAVVALVVDLDGNLAERMPDAGASRTSIEGISLWRLAVAAGHPLPTVLAAITSGGFPVCGAADLGMPRAAPQHFPEKRLHSTLGWS